MRRVFGFLLLVVALAVGVLAFRQPRPEGPTALTVGAFLKERPASPWVRLTEGRLDVLEGAFVRSRAGAVTELLVPLRSEGQPPDGEIRLVVRIRKGDPLFEMLQKGESVSEADAGRFLEQHREAMVPRRPVEGVVVVTDEDDRRKLDGMRPKLASGWVLIEEGLTPPTGPAWPMLMGAAGMALSGLIAIGSLRPAG